MGQALTVKYHEKLGSLCVRLLWRLTRYGGSILSVTQPLFPKEAENQNARKIPNFVLSGALILFNIEKLVFIISSCVMEVKL